MAEKPKIYVDSCCFIEAAKQSIGALESDREKDVWYLWKLLEAHKEGEVRLMTSILTIAECTHADGNMDERIRGLFSRLLMSGEFINLVQTTPFIAADARDLRWKHGILLGGADYLHVASAVDRGCSELLTTDNKILKEAPKIGALGPRSVFPRDTTLLPDKYLQDDLLDGNVTPIRGAGRGKRENQ